MALVIYIRNIIFLVAVFEIISAQYYQPIQIPYGLLRDDHASGIERAVSFKLSSMKEQLRAELKTVRTAQALRMTDVFSAEAGFCEIIKSRVFTMLGPHTSPTLEFLQGQTSTLRMPYITYSQTPLPRGGTSGYMLFMMPNYMAAVVDVLEKYNWKEVVYVYKDEEGLSRVSQLSGVSADKSYFFTIHMLRMSDLIRDWGRLTSIAWNRDGIIVDLPQEESQQLFTKAEDERSKHHFFLMNLDIAHLQLRSFTNGGIAVSGFRIFDNASSTSTSFLSDWERDYKQQFMTQDALVVDAIQLLSQASNKLVDTDPNVSSANIRLGGLWSEWESGTCGQNATYDGYPVPWSMGQTMSDILKNTTFVGLTGTVQFNDAGFRTGYTLELLESQSVSPLLKMGEWTENKGLSLRQYDKPILKPQRGSSQQRKITATSILTQPFLRIVPNDNDYGVTKYEGYIPDLISRMSQILRTEIEIIPVKDANYGSRSDNGTWNGMIGELIREEVDLAAAPLTITAERQSVVQFSHPFMSLGISIMMKKPTTRQPDLFYFLRPFSYEVWCCILFVLIGSSIVLFIVSKLSSGRVCAKKSDGAPLDDSYFTLLNSCWYCFGCIMIQASNKHPRSISGRVLSATLGFFSLILILMYLSIFIGMCVSFTEETEHPIRSAYDLSQQTRVSYGAVEYGSTQEFFRHSSDPIYERMWAYMAAEKTFVRNHEDGIRRVRESNGRFAFLLESTTNNYVNNRMPCDTIKVGGVLNTYGYGLATPYHSQLRDMLNIAILELRESGELVKLERKWFYDTGECGSVFTKASDTVQSEGHFTLEQKQIVFLMLIGGLILAIIVAVFEFLHKGRMEAARLKVPLGQILKQQARLAVKGRLEENLQSTELEQQNVTAPIEETSNAACAKEI